MPKYRNKTTGEVISANSPEEARSIFASKNVTPNRKSTLPSRPTNIPRIPSADEDRGLEARLLDRFVGRRASDILTTPLLPKFETGFAPADWAYENLVRQSTSPVGAAETYLGGKALGAIGKGVFRYFKGGAPGVVAQATAGMATKAPSKITKVAAARANQSLGKRVLDKVADLNNEFKGLYLSSGLPGTNISVHGVSLAARHALSTPLKKGGFIRGAAEVLPMLLSQKYTKKKLGQFTTGQIRHAVKSGAMIDPNTLGASLGKRYSHKVPGLKQVMGIQEELFEKPLFEEFAPALKIRKFYEELPKNIASGMGLGKASRQAGKVSSDIFGGYKSLTNNPTLNSVARAGMLAPDFYKTHVNLLLKMGKGVISPKDPNFRAYRTMAGNLAAATAGLELLNRKMSGKSLLDNEAGYELSLNTGAKTKEGKDIYIPVFGGAADLPRLMVTMLSKGNPIGETKRFIINRMAPLTKPLAQLLDNENWRGQQYWGPNKYPTRVGQYSFRENIPSSQTGKMLAEDYAQIIQPAVINAAIGKFTGNLNKEEAWAKALEMPVRFKKPYESVRKVERRRKPIDLQERERKRKELQRRLTQ